MTIVLDDGFIIIPREFSPDWKVEVIRTDGTVDDVTNDVLYCKYNLIVTEGIGDFEIRLDDGSEVYAGYYSGTEIVRIYIDNGTSASTKRYEGKVEKVKKIYKDSYQLQLIGRHISKELFEILVTKSYSNTLASTILTNLVTSYLTGYTTNNVTATTDFISISWSDKPFWDCIRDLCEMSNFDFYVDDDKDLHFFQRNSILYREEVIWTDEVIEVTGLGDTTFDIKNRVRIYGQDDSGLPVVYTANDLISQAAYGSIEAPPISDGSIKTYEEAKKVGDGQIALWKAKKFQGQAIVYGFPTVLAGNHIWVSLPEHSIQGTYRIMQVTQEIGLEISEGFRTTLSIEKPIKDLTLVLRDSQRSIEGKDTSKSQNPNQLKFSYNFPFSDTSNIESMSSTEISNGKLILSSGANTGTMTTSARTVSDIITKVELRYEGTALDQSTFEISVNNGLNWETVTRDNLLTVANTGKFLKIKVTLIISGSTRGELDGLTILYT